MNKKDFVEIQFSNDDGVSGIFDMVSLQKLFEKKPKDHSQFNYHKVSFYFLFLVTEGHGQYNLNFKNYSYSPGSIFTVRKDSIHKFYKSDADGILILFTKKFILRYFTNQDTSKILLLFNELLASSKVQLSPIDFKDTLALIQQAEKEYSKINDKHSSDILYHFLQIVFNRLLRLKSNRYPILENQKYLVRFIEFQNDIEKFCFQNRKVSFYAKRMNISSKTLNTITKAMVNISPKEFIKTIFIVRLKTVITSSTAPLTSIAYEVGFDEPTNFFKFFKKHCGISAKEFREKAKYNF